MRCDRSVSSGQRARAARIAKDVPVVRRFYSLDCNEGIENAAIGWAQPSPEDT